ncbi:hypothetical protein ACFL54_03130 [Planctomycetota bacterium]
MADIKNIECVNHPGREGIGICVTCKQVICLECGSRLQNILYCRDCLKKKSVDIRRQKIDIFSTIIACLTIVSAFYISQYGFDLAGRSCRAIYAELVHWTSYGGE